MTEAMEVESSLDVLSRAASLVETGSEVKSSLERCDNGSDSGYEDTYTPKPNTLLSKALEFKGNQVSQPMEEEETKPEQVVYRRRKMKCACTQTSGEQPAFPQRPASGPPPLLCVSPRSSFYEEIRPQQRPSVITSTHRRPHTIVGVPYEYNCPQTQLAHRKDVKSLPFVTSGHTDSVVDEHFRRSLGAEYSDFNPSTGSVDDHFAQSLGDAWYRLGINK